MAEKQYIERETLIDHLKKRGAICGFGKYLIRNYPAVDVAPVKHGHWIDETDNRYIVCSVCQRAYDMDFEIRAKNVINFSFCPNCGADMRENT